MPVIHTINGVKISMYFKDHNPPHLHVVDGGNKMKVKLSGQVISGSISEKNMNQVINWIKSNSSSLEKKWKEFTN